MSMCVYLHIYTMSQIYKFNLLSQSSVTCMSVLKLSDNPSKQLPALTSVFLHSSG